MRDTDTDTDSCGHSIALAIITITVLQSQCHSGSCRHGHNSCSPFHVQYSVITAISQPCRAAGESVGPSHLLTLTFQIRSKIQHSAVQDSTLQYWTGQYRAVQCNEVLYIVQCRTVQRSTARCSTMQCSAVYFKHKVVVSYIQTGSE